jgi:hypothetical protein
MTLHDRILAVLAAEPLVRKARPVGSRARGDPTPLSDWDVEVESDDPAALRVRLPHLLAPLEPLAAGWDPNGERPTYMLLLAGPMKVDVILAGDRQPVAGPPHRATGATLPAIDHHFWDWILWLASKRLRGQEAFVAASLRHMHEQLLEPIGVARPPATIGDAIAAYRHAYREAAARLGVARDLRLDDAVAPAVLASLAAPG